MINEENNWSKKPWIKSLIIFSLVLSFLYTFLFFILGLPPLFLFPAYLILLILVLIFAYFNLKLGVKVNRITTFVFTKFIAENKLGLGVTETSGKLVYTWTQPHGKQEWCIALHYKNITLTGFFLIMFVLCGTLFLFGYGFSLINLLLTLIFSLFAVVLLLFMLWLYSKNWMMVMVYEILTEGIYIRHKTLNEPLTGLFVPYTNLENPQFDDKNRLIILKFKGKKYLRRFVTCNSENYKQVSEYIKEKVGG